MSETRRQHKTLQDMSLELGCPLQNGDIIEILQTGHHHFAVYVGDGYIVHITGRLVGMGDDALHGDSVVVEKTMLEGVVKGCSYKVNNIYDGDLIPVPRDEVVSSALQTVGESKPYGSSCRDFALELKFGSANLDIILRTLAAIPEEMAVTAAKGVQLIGSGVSLSSELVGSVAAKGVDLAGQGVMGMSSALGSAAGRGLAAFGNMLSAGAQTLAPIVAAKVDVVSPGSGTMVMTAAGCVAPLAESLAAQSGDAEEATARSVRQLGSSISSGSTSVGSAVSTGLSWLGSASAAGASSIIGYLRSGTELTTAELGAQPDISGDHEKLDSDVQK
ncbi:uncharacterized protein LOC134970033 isoform X1 [Pseudophryne corroboree]|uniref:uncharacterized protein LOC134970033 isoform X1 n=2 Tax=Pseudophryne corroboree TaxID=495146 RepID=UPI0030816D12